MYRATQRDIAQRQAIASLDWRVIARDKNISSSYFRGRDDVTALAVCVKEKRNCGSTVRIVLQALDLGCYPILASTKIDYAILLLVTTTSMTSSNSTGIVTTTGLGFGSQKRAVGLPLMQIRIYNLDYKPAPWRGWFTFNDWHDLYPFSAQLGKVNFLTLRKLDVSFFPV
jgi:hypothetical protein